MKALNNSSVVLATALVAVVGIAYAAQPPNVVASDGYYNTAMGSGALLNLTNGSDNTATGYNALLLNTTGYQNTATGANALRNNTTGIFNNAAGYAALYTNTSGSFNTAYGPYALFYNTTGTDNTAVGVFALVANTTGISNTASGYSALGANTEGNANTAFGTEALNRNQTGRNNVAIGKSAMLDNTTGRNNIAIGWYAGRRTDGNDNILIAHKGVAGESQTMRLGVKGTAGVAGSGITRTFIAGIRGVTTGAAGAAVLIDSKGQLGTISSSREVKENIQPMGTVSERLLALRPVTFQYMQANDDGSKPKQFGLIAEEVAEAFPELVVYDQDGKPETVSYHLLATLLLNEFQKEHSVIEAQATRIASLEEQSAEFAQVKQQVAMMAEVIERLDHDRMVAITQ